MNSPIKVSDDHKIQIIPTPDYTPNQSHEQTPIANSTNSPAPKHGSIGMNEITPEELSSLKADLTRHIWWDELPESISIIDKYPDIIRIPLNDRGDTALHVAVTRGSREIVNVLVNRMSPEEMLIPNSVGKLPVHLAASYGYNRMVDILSSQKVLDKMKSKDIERLFFMTISINMFDLAMRLFGKHPTTLAIARNEEELTALQMLARKPPKILDMEGERSEGGRLFKKLWTQLNELEHKRMIMSPVLFDAIKSGNFEAVRWITEIQPELVTIKDPENGRNLLHLVVLFQQKRIFNSIPWGLKEHHLVRAVDDEGNNILHLAAHLPPVEFQEFSSLRASIQMQRDITWFKFVERYAPNELRTMRNNMSKTPIDVFCDEHKKLSEEIKDAAKEIANSGMLVSTLVATVAFAAALTVPGDKTDAWFTVFILTNALSHYSLLLRLYSHSCQISLHQDSHKANL